MVHAKHIGRVGALAVALGVGMAVASTPGVAYAKPSDSSSTSSSTDDSSAAASGAPSSGKSDGKKVSASDAKPRAGSADEQPKFVADREVPSDADAADDEEVGGAVEAPDIDKGDEDASTAVSDGDSDSGDSADEPVPSKPAGGRHARALSQPDASADVESSVTEVRQSARSGRQMQTLSIAAATELPVRRSLAAPALADVATALAPPVAVTPAPAPDLEEILEEPHTFFVGFVAHVVDAVLEPLLAPFSPMRAPLLWTMLAFVRDEFRRITLPNLSADPATPSLVEGPNLLVNPGAELGDPSLSGYSAVSVPGWALTGTPTVIDYGTQRRFPVPTPSPGPVLPDLLAFPSRWTSRQRRAILRRWPRGRFRPHPNGGPQGRGG